jgi:hypothetical protein
MGYFDGVTEASFKKNKEGQTLYYPWGIFGKGYLITDAAKESQLRNFTKYNYMLILPLVILNQIIFGPVPNLIIFPIYTIIFIALIKKFTNGLPVVTEKLKVSEAYRNSAKRHDLFTLIILDIVALLFVALGLLFVIEKRNTLLGIFAIVLFGLAATTLSYMAWSKIKHK